MPRADRRRKAPMPDETCGPTDAQLGHGLYTVESIPHPEGGNRVAQAYVNRGGTPLARWMNTGKLSDTQRLAIDMCLRLWAIVGTEPRTTASYGERIASSGNEERRAGAFIEARSDLYRIQDYVPLAYWQLFENVCRWDEPAGIAGSKLGFGGRAAIERAHTVVCFVADVIAMREGLVPVARIRAA